MLIKTATTEILGRSPSDAEEEAFVKDTSPTAGQMLIGSLLAERFGVYELLSKEVVDFHTQSIDVPASIFKSALEKSPPQGVPALKVGMRCESGGQYVGVAKRDFYILSAEKGFAWNFIKGSLGLWLRLCIVMGLAVACSTYLSGVIAWFTALFIFIAGFFQEYIQKLASGTAIGGGPMESFLRLVNKESMAVPLDQTPGGKSLAEPTDAFYSWLMRRVLNIIPDVDQLDWTKYVAEGFNISTWNLFAVHAVLVFGYLLPWAVLAYYLMKSREIASA